jgi:hypothetical protein
LTAKPDSDIGGPFNHARGDGESGKGCAGLPQVEPLAPEDADYPDVVLAHLLDSKSPLTAWRLYWRMTLAQLGDQYGAKRESHQ